MNTTDATPAADRGSECNDLLGPEERAKLDALLDHIYEHGTTAEGVLLRAAQLCQAVRAAERERCAKLAADERFVYSDDEWRVRCEVADAIRDPDSGA